MITISILANFLSINSSDVEEFNAVTNNEVNKKLTINYFDDCLFIASAFFLKRISLSQ